MTEQPLDLDLVLAFVRVAEFSSFTRAAEALGATQAGISLKVRKLEQRLGRTLLERTPRLVRLTPDGTAFLDRARRLLAMEREAWLWDRPNPPCLRLGFSDHAVGDALAPLLRRVAAAVPDLRMEVQLGFSRSLLDAYDSGAFDAVIVRREGDRRDGELLRRDPYGWFAARDFAPGGTRLPLALLAAPCGVRATATRALEAAGIGWSEAFVGGSVSSVAAAVAAGIAIAPMAAHLAPPGSTELSRRLNLPPLPPAPVMLISRAGEPAARRALAELAAGLRPTRGERA
ncbi:LysR family transcriptional regulator [Ancylobacter radicis]|uniref:LysR family transcriptional regulator n=1 Tax=Ancylobacter radicis TaxID=2836179 RepID=A0ABS5R9M9_9HYPH|nr:LysR substrate-binding domain-containing protein [Ancylobacter radicis]MBS9478363.1 LysR family transcriptional regulator [Ancylobacter radicis]